MEILIWGDNMKRQINISIFLAILLVVMVWLYIKFYNETKLPEDRNSTEMSMEEDAITISQEYVSYMFYIKESYGRIVVYDTKNQTVYMETSIVTETLPTDIQTELKTGIYFKTEVELYDFLESYSS